MKKILGCLILFSIYFYNVSAQRIKLEIDDEANSFFHKHDTSLYINYAKPAGVNSVIDSVYVFYLDPSQMEFNADLTKDLNRGVLFAEQRDGAADDWTYEWAELDTINKIFTIRPETVNKIDSLKTGSYRVVMTKKLAPAEKDTVFAWILNDVFELDVQHLNRDKCNIVQFDVLLNLEGRTKKFVSFNPYNLKERNELKIEVADDAYTWTAAPSYEAFEKPDENAGIDLNKEELNISSSKKDLHPKEITTFTYTCKDNLGFEHTWKKVYEPIRPFADYEFKIIDDGTSEEPSGNSGSAPVEIQFTNKSLNADYFRLYYHGTPEENPDTILYHDSQIDQIANLTLDIPDVYDFSYVARKTSEIKYETFVTCVDSIPLSPDRDTIRVTESKFELPNFLYPESPNPDNRYFRAKAESIKSIKIRIYNRSGVLVHKYDGDYADWEEKGWDGTVRSTGRKATNGTYFYKIKAVGYDGVGYPLKGTVFLIRKE